MSASAKYGQPTLLTWLPIRKATNRPAMVQLAVLAWLVVGFPAKAQHSFSVRPYYLLPSANLPAGWETNESVGYRWP
jgi:hypothetical protein